MSLAGSILIAVGKRLLPTLVIGYFTKERGECHRASDRERWWKFAQRAKLSPGKADDAIATYLQARFNFHDSPEAKASKDMAMRAGLLHDTSKPVVYPAH